MKQITLEQAVVRMARDEAVMMYTPVSPDEVTGLPIAVLKEQLDKGAFFAILSSTRTEMEQITLGTWIPWDFLQPKEQGREVRHSTELQKQWQNNGGENA